MAAKPSLLAPLLPLETPQASNGLGAPQTTRGTL